jgi:DNA-binding transcriptional regulator YhcF (GntR family)
MARPRVSRSLAKLRRHRSVSGREPRAEQLLAVLREVAIAAQREQPQVFYSIREVARKFHTPLATVSKLYQQLSREGILSPVRGSKTTLHGLKNDRKLTVRAFVGLPASISSLVTHQDYRMFFIQIRRELRLRGFAAAMVFFDQESNIDFPKRIQKYEIDTVVWFSPELRMRDAVLKLKDIGIRIVGVSCGGLAATACRYEIHRGAAIKAILDNWMESGVVKSATIVASGAKRVSSADEQRLHLILEQENIRHMFINWDGTKIDALLQSLARKESSGIILLHPAASMLSFRAPGRLIELFEKRRVALVDGPVNTPFARVPDARVDLVVVDWQLVAERIVSDLISQEAFETGRNIIFQAEAKLRAPLSDYAQTI